MPQEQNDHLNRLTDDICNYLDFLCDTFHYKISIHEVGGECCSKWHRFMKYWYHLCPLCREIKSSPDAWNHCVKRQKGVTDRISDPMLIGTCYAGVSECVFPLRDVHGVKRGFLSVSGYTVNREESRVRALAACQKYKLPEEQVLQAVDCLNADLPDLKLLQAQIAPVQNMMTLLFHLNESDRGVLEDASNPRKALYLQIIRHVNYNYRKPNFSLKDACKHLNISYAYASHLFSEFCDVSFSRYVRRLRIETAKMYLKYSFVEPIAFVAAESGFSDANYFSSLFKEETGVSPHEWRELYGLASDALPACAAHSPKALPSSQNSAPQSKKH